MTASAADAAEATDAVRAWLDGARDDDLIELEAHTLRTVLDRLGELEQQPRPNAVLGGTDDGRLHIVCPACDWDAVYPCLDLITATAIVREHIAAHVPLCDCGCVPGEPCGCGVDDCECLGECPVCDADEALAARTEGDH